jgi:hypothetical protein
MEEGRTMAQSAPHESPPSSRAVFRFMYSPNRKVLLDPRTQWNAMVVESLLSWILRSLLLTFRLRRRAIW